MSRDTKETTRPVVIGEGWAALGALIRELARGVREPEAAPILWLAGSGGRAIATLPSIEGDEAATLLESAAEFLDLPLGPRVAGTSFVREFRNRSFREPVWSRKDSAPEQRKVRSAELWAPEAALVPVDEVRWESSLVEIEEQLRERLLQHPGVKRLSGVPVEGFKVLDGAVKAVMLASGDEIETDHVIYADRWSQLGRLTGLPKAMGFLRGREPMGVLQAVFTHSTPLLSDVTEGFYSALTRESGDAQERQVFGHFYRGGSESVWSSVISPEEGDDNHLIAKRLRRMKQALEKMFAESDWVKGEFGATIKNEQVRYEEGIVLSEGEAPEAALTLSKGAQSLRGIEFVTDGYGVGSAMLQCLRAAGLKPSVQP